MQDAAFDFNPLARIALTTKRSWTDTDQDYMPDCNLGNPAKNGECGAMENSNFGQNVFSQTFAPALVRQLRCDR